MTTIIIITLILAIIAQRFEITDLRHTLKVVTGFRD